MKCIQGIRVRSGLSDLFEETPARFFHHCRKRHMSEETTVKRQFDVSMSKENTGIRWEENMLVFSTHFYQEEANRKYCTVVWWSDSFHSNLVIRLKDPNTHSPWLFLSQAAGRMLWSTSITKLHHARLTPPCFEKQVNHILKGKCFFHILADLLLASQQPLQRAETLIKFCQVSLSNSADT